MLIPFQLVSEVTLIALSYDDLDLVHEALDLT